MAPSLEKQVRTAIFWAVKDVELSENKCVRQFSGPYGIEPSKTSARDNFPDRNGHRDFKNQMRAANIQTVKDIQPSKNKCVQQFFAL